MRSTTGQPLPQLSIPQELLEGYQHTLHLRNLVFSEVLTRTNAGINRWIAAGEGQERDLRRAQVALTFRFLDGRPLEEAEEVLREQYQTMLAGPEARAALFFLAAREEGLVPESPEEAVVVDVARLLSASRSCCSPPDGGGVVACCEENQTP